MPNLDKALREYLAGPTDLPFDMAMVAKAPVQQQKPGGGGGAAPLGFSPLKKSVTEQYEEQLLQVGKGARGIVLAGVDDAPCPGTAQCSCYCSMAARCMV